MARRQGYVERFKARFRDVPSLVFDAGYFFSDRINFTNNRLTEDAALGNEWVIRAYNQMGLDAVNVSWRDLPQLTTCFKVEEHKKHVSREPIVNRFISANVKPRSKGIVAPQPFIIRELKGGRLKNKTIRIGVIGLTEKGAASTTAFEIADPLVVAGRLVPQVRSQADILIVMAYMQPEMVDRLAERNPQIDVILADAGRPYINQEKTLGKTQIVFATYQTKLLGELRLYEDGPGGVKKFVNRYIELDDVIPDDPPTERLRAQARKELSVVQQKLAREMEREWQAQRASSGFGGTDVAYVGSDSCQACHAAAYQTWARSGHAHAYATLQKVKRENDSQCVACHVTGLDAPSGFVNSFSTPNMKDVQCEACHGAGSQHVKNPNRNYGQVPMPAGCVSCHTRENSPDFMLATYWARIKH